MTAINEIVKELNSSHIYAGLTLGQALLAAPAEWACSLLMDGAAAGAFVTYKDAPVRYAAKKIMEALESTKCQKN